MQIEKWVLIEMIPRFQELQAQGHITHGECEHKYTIKKTTRYEHCDVWWQQDDDEHWLEVKTIVLTRDAQLDLLLTLPKTWQRWTGWSTHSATIT